MNKLSSPPALLACATLVVVGISLVWRAFQVPAPILASQGAREAGATSSTAGLSDAPSPSDVIQRMLAGEFPRLTPEQIAAYVESKNHSALSLVAAWHLSRDAAWLREAAERHPEDPDVAAAMLASEGVKPGSERWIEVLKRAEPGNALGSLYAAKAALDEGLTSDAMAELSGLGPRSRLDLPTDRWSKAMIEAYHSAGYQGLEAEWAGLAQVSSPWGHIRTLNVSLAEAMTLAAESGDRQMAAQFGETAMKTAALVNHQGDGDSLLTQLVSLSMERQVLNQMEGFDLIPGDQKLVVERLSEMDRRIAGIKELISKSQLLLPKLTDSEARQYTRRVRVEGELKAMRWLVSQRLVR